MTIVFAVFFINSSISVIRIGINTVSVLAFIKDITLAALLGQTKCSFAACWTGASCARQGWHSRDGQSLAQKETFWRVRSSQHFKTHGLQNLFDSASILDIKAFTVTSPSEVALQSPLPTNSIPLRPGSIILTPPPPSWWKDSCGGALIWSFAPCLMGGRCSRLPDCLPRCAASGPGATGGGIAQRTSLVLCKGAELLLWKASPDGTTNKVGVGDWVVTKSHTAAYVIVYAHH